MRHIGFTSLFALAVGLSAASGLAQDAATTPAPSPGGFRLPTNPTPTPTDVQGPVDPDAPILTRPRAPTPTPTPRATVTPAPTPAPAPAPTQRAVAPPRNSTLPPRFTPPAATDSPAAEAVADAVADSPAPFPSTPGTSPALLPPFVGQAPAPTTTTMETTQPDDGGTPWWLMALGAFLALGAIGGALLFLRKRSGSGSFEQAPEIEKPRVTGGQGATPPAPALSGPPLLIEAQVRQLARSMMFATLTYDLKVTNRGPMPLENVSFGGDFVTAHARVPTHEQLADPAVALTPVQSLTRLDPGESASFAGEFRLPVSEIRPIPHGKAVVYVPLLRVRAEAEGIDPIARTFIVGLTSPGSNQRLQPFRLDEMPQTYRTVGQKALD